MVTNAEAHTCLHDYRLLHTAAVQCHSDIYTVLRTGEFNILTEHIEETAN